MDDDRLAAAITDGEHAAGWVLEHDAAMAALLDLRDARAELRGIRGRCPDVRLIRVSTPLLGDLVARTEDGARMTAEWGEPDEFGVYNPIFTRHNDDSLGVLLARAREALFNLVVDADALWGSAVDQPSREAKKVLHDLDAALETKP